MCFIIILNNICKPNLEKLWVELNRNRVTHSYDHQAAAVLRTNSSSRRLENTQLIVHQSVLAGTLFFAVECWGGNIKGRDADRISKLVKKTWLCWRARTPWRM